MKLRIKDIPSTYPVRPLKRHDSAKDRATCGTCELSWDDGISTGITPTPAGRCPFEDFHKEESGDVECVNCGKRHDSAGLLPLCEACTKKHAEALGLIKEEPMTRAPKEGVEQLRQAVRLFNNTNETFNTRYTATDLIKIYHAFMRSEWDITPDQWTETEVKDAIAGIGTGATSER